MLLSTHVNEEAETMSKDKPRIYLAGPEVFLPDAKATGERKAALCADAGFEGIFPLDQALDLSGLPDHEKARRIALADEAMMRSCDAAIANLTPFRGVSMDSGTAYEIGFMRALERPVFGYSNVAADYKTRAEAWRRLGSNSPDADRADVQIEDFGLAENLMIAIGIVESGGTLITRSVALGSEMTDLEGFKACLQQASQLLLS
jgi:nucleoside 2-deoxyribosyltransferase